MADILNEIFPLPVTAAATNTSQPTLKSWNTKGLLKAGALARIEGGGGPGRGLGFGLHTVIQAGIAKTVLDHGQPHLAWAFDAARTFAQVGSEKGELERSPGVPFRENGVATLLIVAGPNSVVLPWWPLGRDSEGRRTPDPIGIARTHFGRLEGFLVIDCDLAFQRIIRGLGRNPNEVMAAAYGTAG